MELVKEEMEGQQILSVRLDESFLVFFLTKRLLRRCVCV